MERRLKERLVGAAVLVMLAVIIIPMILDDSVENEVEITTTNIPPRPDGEFRSRIIPIEPAHDQVEISDPPEMVPVAPPETTTRSVIDPDQTIAAGSAVQPDTPAGEDAEQPRVDPSPDTDTPSSGQQPGGSPVVASGDSRETGPPRGLTAWVVQLGSFSSEENASTLVKNLREQDYPAYLETLDADSGKIYRVRVGPELLRADAEKIRDKLSEQVKLDGIILRYP